MNESYLIQIRHDSIYCYKGINKKSHLFQVVDLAEVAFMYEMKGFYLNSIKNIHSIFKSY